jgi:hypothetical protein
MENKTIINEPKIKLVLQDDELKFENVDGIIDRKKLAPLVREMRCYGNYSI